MQGYTLYLNHSVVLSYVINHDFLKRPYNEKLQVYIFILEHHWNCFGQFTIDHDIVYTTQIVILSLKPLAEVIWVAFMTYVL